MRLIKEAFPETATKDEGGLAWTLPAEVKQRGVCMESSQDVPVELTEEVDDTDYIQ